MHGLRAYICDEFALAGEYATLGPGLKGLALRRNAVAASFPSYVSPLVTDLIKP
jgi:hypothetical protein